MWGKNIMPGDTGKWTWNQPRTSGNVVAVMLVRPNHSIALTFPRPDGWTGERKQDQDLIRAMLLSAVEERWSSGSTEL